LSTWALFFSSYQPRERRLGEVEDKGVDKFQRVEYYYLANKETSSNF
jgi:hypothetical protein